MSSKLLTRYLYEICVIHALYIELTVELSIIFVVVLYIYLRKYDVSFLDCLLILFIIINISLYQLYIYTHIYIYVYVHLIMLVNFSRNIFILTHQL